MGIFPYSLTFIEQLIERIIGQLIDREKELLVAALHMFILSVYVAAMSGSPYRGSFKSHLCIMC